LNSQRVSMLNRGVSYIEDISNDELAALVVERNAVQSNAVQSDVAQPVTADARASQARNGNAPTQAGNGGSFAATTDYAILSDCDAVTICVPTPLNKTGDPDMSFIHN